MITSFLPYYKFFMKMIQCFISQMMQYFISSKVNSIQWNIMFEKVNWIEIFHAFYSLIVILVADWQKSTIQIADCCYTIAEL